MTGLTLLEREAKKSPSHKKGWRTRRRLKAASVDRARVIEVAHELRRQCAAVTFHTKLPDLPAAAEARGARANTQGNDNA